MTYRDIATAAIALALASSSFAGVVAAGGVPVSGTITGAPGSLAFPAPSAPVTPSTVTNQVQQTVAGAGGSNGLGSQIASIVSGNQGLAGVSFSTPPSAAQLQQIQGLIQSIQDKQQ